MKNCCIFFPIHGLRLGSAIGKEIRIDRVTLLAAEKIPHIRKRLGIVHPVSYYNKQHPPPYPRLFTAAATYALIRSNRDPDQKDVWRERKAVQEALWILAASLIGSKDRGRYHFSMRPYIGGKLYESVVIFEHKGPWAGGLLERMTPAEEYSLDQEWKAIMKRLFFPQLIRIVNGQVTVHPKWRQTIRQAAILAGRSYLSRTVHDAFVSSMIAIETLLARRMDKFPDVLIDRIVSLFGWLTDDELQPWSHLVKRLYSLRCSYVHDGKSGEITGLDLYYADLLLFNILTNVCENALTFRSKDDVIAFAERVRARRVLGMPLRPKGPHLHFLGRGLSRADRQRIVDVSRWAW